MAVNEEQSLLLAFSFFFLRSTFTLLQPLLASLRTKPCFHLLLSRTIIIIFNIDFSKASLIKLAVFITLASTKASEESHKQNLRKAQTTTLVYPRGVGFANSAFATYVLIGPKVDHSDSGLIARTVFPAGILCSDVDLTLTLSYENGDQILPMPQRLKPQVPAHAIVAFASVTVCEAALPKGVVSVKLGIQVLPVKIPDKVSNIAVFGDADGRANAFSQQKCNDLNAWPLAKIAARIADSSPELTFFIGDFYYRENDCYFDNLAA